jgi:hypothetical protein
VIKKTVTEIQREPRRTAAPSAIGQSERCFQIVGLSDSWLESKQPFARLSRHWPAIVECTVTAGHLAWGAEMTAKYHFAIAHRMQDDANAAPQSARGTDVRSGVIDR